MDLALYFNAASYFVSALTVYSLREIPKRNASATISAPVDRQAIWEGWRFIGQTPVVRGLVIGMVGAFAAAGVVVGLGQPYINYTLHGGNAGLGLVFAAIFVGMAVGMVLGTRSSATSAAAGCSGSPSRPRRSRSRSSPWCRTWSWSSCSWC